jgi:hypothetical protein
MYATLDEWQILLLWRLRHADYVKPADVHDFAVLMGKDLDSLPHGWLAATYDAYQALGLLHDASGAASGACYGRLSPRARWLLDDLNDDAA